MIQGYKGVRDFYPEDQRVQAYMFDAMRRAVERFGYEAMNASVLELSDLYLTKTSEEIVREEAYTFEDRGGRSVTLRPEMTPTVARMVSAKSRDLGFPLRWYSIQNMFRYQKPQRGRLREHWQLNADLFGVSDSTADREIILVAREVMRELGASEKDFSIRISSRQVLEALYDELAIPADARQEVTRLLDKKEKVDIRTPLEEKVGKDAARALLKKLETLAPPEALKQFIDSLHEAGCANVTFDPNITRGFDYYTGMVFEVFDTHKDNKRSLFGGGRYDNLISQFGGGDIPAVGFGMGDVTTRDFLETHNLLPVLAPSTHLYVAPATDADEVAAEKAATLLRAYGVSVALGMKHRKFDDHKRHARKLAIPHFLVWGENEEASGVGTVTSLETKESFEGSLEDIAARVVSE